VAHGEDVAVKRPNLYAAEVWDQVTDAMAKGDAKAIRESLVEFVAMVCPSKTVEQIREECDDEYLFLVAGYANGRLNQARAFLEELAGKVAGATASPPDAPTGTSPVESPALAALPCGS
jgi:hypothetical protein